MNKAWIFTGIIAAALSGTALGQDDPPGRWTEKAAPGAPSFAGGGFATDGSSLYLLAGDSYAREVRKYDPVANDWSALPDIPYQMFETCAAYSAGSLYCFGRLDLPPPPGELSPPSNPVLRYTLSTGVWTALTAKVTYHKYSAGAGALGSKIYIAGGDGPTSHFSEFDPATGTVTAKAAMPKALTHPTVIGMESTNRLYVIGGTTGWGGPVVPDCYEYNPVSNSWTRRANIAVDGVDAPRGGGSAFAMDGRIYLAGGDSPALTPTTLEFDPALNGWTRRADLVRARSYAAVAVIAGRAFLYGGSYAATSMEQFTPPSAAPVASLLRQVNAGGADIAAGGAATGQVRFAAALGHPAPISPSRFEVEIRPLGAADWASATTLTGGMGAPGNVELAWNDPPPGSYEWRGRAVDDLQASAWTDFGGTAASADFIVLAPVEPPAPEVGSNGGMGCGGSATGATALVFAMAGMAAALRR